MTPADVGEPSKSSRRMGIGSGKTGDSGERRDLSRKLSEAPESISALCGVSVREGSRMGRRSEDAVARSCEIQANSRGALVSQVGSETI